MGRGFRATKSLEELQAENNQATAKFKKMLSSWHLVALGIGVVVGAGIFVMTGQVAAQHTGPAIVLSMAIASFVCIFAGVCYAEFAALLPVSGGAYSYTYFTMGEFLAWIIGWNLMLEYLFGASAVAVGWSGYLASFLNDLGLPLADALTNPTFQWNAANHRLVFSPSFNLPAVLIILALSGLLTVGIKASTRFNNVIVAIKLIIIVLFITCGLTAINPSNWVPFLPANTGDFGQFGWSGVLRGAGIIFFAYLGFDAISTATQETKNPQRDMPRGIIGAIVVTTILYMAVGIILTGIVHYPELNVPDPIAVAVNALGPSLAKLRTLIKFGIVAGITSVILVMIYAQSRIFYAMAKDDLLPAFFGHLNPRFKTPTVGIWITALICILMAGLFPIGILGEMVCVGTLFAFGSVCLCVLILRSTKPDLPRPFKVPAVKWVTIIGAILSYGQIAFLSPGTMIRFFGWSAVGIIIYLCYGRFSHQRKG